MTATHQKQSSGLNFYPTVVFFPMSITFSQSNSSCRVFLTASLILIPDEPHVSQVKGAMNVILYEVDRQKMNEECVQEPLVLKWHVMSNVSI